MRCKSGQAYFVAAFAIIVIMISIVTISNYATRKQGSEVVYDWKDELQIESAHVMDYGTTHGLNNTQLLENFTAVFSNYSKETEFYFVFGKNTSVVAYKYFDGARENADYQKEGNIVNLTVENTIYSFNLTQGENFFFVILDKKGSDKYIATNIETPSSSSSGSGGGCTADCTGIIDSYTKLLLHMDDVGLTDAIGHSVTLNGNAARSSAQYKFPVSNGYSAYFDGNDDYLTIPDSDDWNLGTGDFTIDMWVYFPSGERNCRLIMWGSQFNLQFYVGDTHNLYINSEWAWLNKPLSLPTNQWVHVALVRSGTDFSLYINGIKIYNAVNSKSISSDMINIGSNGGSNAVGYYIDELRISKGVARWTSNFNDKLPNVPYPLDKECGDDGCGGSCGICSVGSCVSGYCV